jgi:integrase
MGGKREKHYRIRDGQVYARLTYTDAGGKRHDLMRKAESITHAREIVKRLRREIEEHGEQTVAGSQVTFRELAKVYEEQKLQPAQYRHDRKIAGRRSYETPRAHLKTLVSHFGARRIRNITHADVENFRQSRLHTPTVRGSERTVASVNRELEVLRAAFRFAVRQGWIIRSPFETGDALISKADEVHRDRILTREEEARLLAACTGRRAHLRPLLVCALDTAMRRGEMFKLKWSDVDLDSRLISVRATTTKTARGRTIGMTSRVAAELRRLWEASLQEADGLVFGVTDTVKTSFASACREAGVENFRLHDCRHTAITRMIQAGMPPMQVMKISGHTQMTTFARYVNVDEQAAKRAASALDAFHAESSAVMPSEVEYVN